MKKSKTQSEKAGLTLPVGRIARHLKGGRFAKRIGRGAPIFMAAVLEYLTTEVLELAGNIANKNDRQRITPRYVQLAVRTDEELSKFLGNVIIAAGGVCSEQVTYPTTAKPAAPRKKKSVQKKEDGVGAHSDDDDVGDDEDRDNVNSDSQQY